jgi:uncharacterized membrane protein YjjP (DUF1212 family)
MIKQKIIQLINEATDGFNSKQKKIYAFYLVVFACGLSGAMISYYAERFDALFIFAGFIVVSELGSRMLKKDVENGKKNMA